MKKNANGKTGWSFEINAEIEHALSEEGSVSQVASMFGLRRGLVEKLYNNFNFEISPGQIVAVIGPSGAGKSVLLQKVMNQTECAVKLGRFTKSEAKKSAVDLIDGKNIKRTLAMLAKCGLAEATVLTCPAGLLSGGQQYRLSLARILHKAKMSSNPQLVIADEFCSTLDITTASVLCRQMRKFVNKAHIAFLIATPRVELLNSLQPDRIIVKPMGGEAKFYDKAFSEKKQQSKNAKRPLSKNYDLTLPNPKKWPVVRGRLADYRKLEQYHYIAGPPACNKRVYVIRPPKRFQQIGAPEIAAVLIVSPPVISVRGRNVATFGRYVDADRKAALMRLNSEMETISRVVVHPVFRGCGLARKLVKHAIATSPMPMVEALAAMGKIHPLFHRAGMRQVGIFKGPNQYYHYYIARKQEKIRI